MEGDKKILADLRKLIGKENVSGSIYERISYGQDAAQPVRERSSASVRVIGGISRLNCAN